MAGCVSEVFQRDGVSGRLLQTTPAVVSSLEPSGPSDCFEGRGTEEVSMNCGSVSIVFRDESEIQAGVV